MQLFGKAIRSAARQSRLSAGMHAMLVLLLFSMQLLMAVPLFCSGREERMGGEARACEERTTPHDSCHDLRRPLSGPEDHRNIVP